MPFKSGYYLTITELIHLLETHTISRDECTLKVADRRLTCGINSCQWQGVDNTDLSNHVQAAHEEGKSDICKLQRVVTETELQQVAANGTKVIDEIEYHIVEHVCYLFSVGRGKWFSSGQENVYNIQSKLTAKEVDLLKKLQDMKEQMNEELTRKDQAIKEARDASDLAQEQIAKLRNELEEREMDLRNLQDATTIDGAVGNPLEQEIDVNSLRESFNAGTEKLDKLVTGLHSALNDITSGPQEREKKHHLRIEDLEKEASRWKGAYLANKELIDNAIATHKRFFLYAKEGVIDKTITPYKRSELNCATLKNGSDVAHRANIVSHLILLKRGDLNEEEVKRFKIHTVFVQRKRRRHCNQKRP